MRLNIFFHNRKERTEFLENELNIQSSEKDEYQEKIKKIKGFENIKLKNRFKTIPGYWVEILFTPGKEGEELYRNISTNLGSERVDKQVFYPVKNQALEVLEENWIRKYNLLYQKANGDAWTIFLREIKTHMEYNRVDIAYKGLIVFMKYNPFFLKKYKRFYVLEELAYLYEDMGNLGRAIKCLKMQTLLRPDSIEPHLNISSFYLVNGMEDEAFKACKEALKKNPENEYLISNLVISLMNLGNYDYALNFLKKVLNKNPDNPYFWKLMGDIFYEIRSSEIAIEFYNKTLELEEEPFIDDFKLDIYTSIGDCYYEEANYPEAIEYYKKALEYNPKDPYLLMSLGQITFFRLQETKTAYMYTQMLVESAPENGYAQFQMGLIHCRMGNLEEAIWHLYKARRIIPYYKPVHEAIGMVKKSNRETCQVIFN